MKRLSLLLFAAALPCQNGTKAVDPKQELAAVIAVEEQEGDLAKAEKLYREQLAGTALSDGARRLANRRLGALLLRLGKEAEAKPFVEAGGGGDGALAGFDDFGPQDAEREAALRAEAAKLLEVARGRAERGNVTPFSPGEREQLQWLGDAAVPVVIAELESLEDSVQAYSHYLEHLAGFLWHNGSAKSNAFLARAATVPAWGRHLAVQAWQLRTEQSMAVAAAFLRNPDMPVVRTLLDAGQDGRLRFRLPASAILGLAEAGDAERASYVLSWGAEVDLEDPKDARCLVALVAKSLDSTNPQLGTLAARCLYHLNVQRCLEGLELLLAQLRVRELALRFRGLPIDVRDVPDHIRPSAAARARLWPQVLTTARELGEEHPGRGWVTEMIGALLEGDDQDRTAELLDLAERGYGVFGLIDVRSDNAIAILQRVRHPANLTGTSLLRSLASIDLPREAAPLLLELLGSQRQLDRQAQALLCAALGKTGHPAAFAWLRDENKVYDYVVDAIVQCVRRSDDPGVHAQLREMVPNLRNPNAQTAFVLALLAMGDAAALDLVNETYGPLMHPFAASANPVLLTPLQYLLRKDPDPPHPFTAAQIEGVLQRLCGERAGFIPVSLADQVDDAMVQLVALYERGTFNVGRGYSRNWVEVALQRAREQKGANGWNEWIEQSLTDVRVTYSLLGALDKDEILAHLPQIEKLAAGGDFANVALDALVRAERPIDVVALLAHADNRVRQWAFARVVYGEAPAPAAAMLPFLASTNTGQRLGAANWFGNRLHKEGVPGLIALLRDEDEKVREAAQAALTRIRFYHEQEAHWDRVLQGLDASPASAMEKLLLQARPKESKAQRLLAITSLGALGVPEALPFLIDWSNEADAEVAAAAKAAITKIHLQPRR